MTWKYDPSNSSSQYHVLAKKRQARGPVRLSEGLAGILEDYAFRNVVHSSHLHALQNSENWSQKVKEKGAKPRVFVDMWTNQLGNLEVRTGSGRAKVFYPADYASSYQFWALSGNNGSLRSEGELAWVRHFHHYAGLAVELQHPVAKAVVYAIKARLDELIESLSSTHEVVGAMTLEFGYRGKQLKSVKIVSPVPEERLRAMRDAAWSEVCEAIM